MTDTGKQAAATATATIGKEHYQTTITTGVHTVTADEPAEVGGADAAPNPHQLLLASLGSCMAITLRMYLDRKKWNADEVTINLELYNLEDLTLIETKISIKGELDTQQKERLMHIANACPIHKLLTRPISIETVGIHMK